MCVLNLTSVNYLLENLIAIFSDEGNNVCTPKRGNVESIKC